MEIIKLNDLNRWAEWPAESSIGFQAGNPRKFRLTLNCRSATSLYIEHVDGLTGEVSGGFLTAVPAGVSLVEFIAGANAFRLLSDAVDPVLYLSAELEPASFASDAESFTKIAHRRARNPELEEMMFLMNANMERRLAIMDQDHARQLAELKQKGIENGEVVRSGGNLHVGAPAQREELAAEAAGGSEAGAVVKRGAPRKGDGAAAPAGDGDSGEAGGGEA